MTLCILACVGQMNYWNVIIVTLMSRLFSKQTVTRVKGNDQSTIYEYLVRPFHLPVKTDNMATENTESTATTRAIVVLFLCQSYK